MSHLPRFRYHASSPGQCGVCWDVPKAVRTVSLVSAVVAAVVLVWYIDRTTFSGSLKPLQNSSVLLKMFLGHLQVAGMLTEYVFEANHSHAMC